MQTQDNPNSTTIQPEVAGGDTIFAPVNLGLGITAVGNLENTSNTPKRDSASSTVGLTAPNGVIMPVVRNIKVNNKDNDINNDNDSNNFNNNNSDIGNNTNRNESY